MRTNEELARDAQNGNSDAINELWAQCYGFIRQYALRWARAWQERADFDADDLTQCGFLALRKAVSDYQTERGGFLGYLLLHMKTEFAKCAGCRTKAQAAAPLNHAVSLDAPVGNDSESSIVLGDTIPTEEQGFETVEDDIYKQQVAIGVRAAVADLPERQRIAVETYYLQGRTYTETGKALNVSKAYAALLAKNGLKNLRNGTHVLTLTELLYGEMNLYKHTGFSAFRESGCSIQERSVIWKEREIERHDLEDSRASKIRYCIDVLNMSREQAESLFPV